VADVTGDGDGLGEVVETAFWDPHASPASVWGLIATYPLVVVAVYRRSWPLFVATLCSVVVNLRIPSPPEDDTAWATRVVLGERVWLDRGLSSQPTALAVTGVGAAVQLYTLRAALARRPGRTVLGTVASVLSMFVFFEQMVRLYERRGTASPDRDSGPE
jgi:hypothetical protein